MAADTFSAILGWVNQGTGNNNNSWGDVCDNSIFPIFERGIAGLSVQNVTGGTLDLSSDAPPNGPTKALDMIQAFTGTLASNQTVVVPNLSKVWVIYNGTTGAFALNIKTPDGAQTSIPQGGWCIAFCDGGDTIYAGISTTARDIQWLGADGTISAPGLSFAAEPTIGFRRKDTGVIALTIGGVDVVTFTATSLTLNAGASSNLIPAGTEADFAGPFEPDGWYFEFGQTKSRSTDAGLFNAITALFTADTNGTVTLSNVSKDLRGLGLEGSPLEGTGIQTGTTIVSVDSATQITMSSAATNTATGGSIRAMPHGVGDGSTTFNLPDGRDLVYAGRGNMGGTKRNLITVAGSGVNSSKMTGVGGSETVTMVLANLIQHDHSVFLHDPGHSHNYITPNGVSIGGAGILHYLMDNLGSFGTATTSNTTGITLWSDGDNSGSQNKVGKTGSATPTGMRVVQPTAFRNKIIKR